MNNPIRKKCEYTGLVILRGKDFICTPWSLTFRHNKDEGKPMWKRVYNGFRICKNKTATVRKD